MRKKRYFFKKHEKSAVGQKILPRPKRNVKIFSRISTIPAFFPFPETQNAHRPHRIDFKGARIATEARLASFGYRSTPKAKPPLKTHLSKVKIEIEKVKGFIDIHGISTIPAFGGNFPQAPYMADFHGSGAYGRGSIKSRNPKRKMKRTQHIVFDLKQAAWYNRK